MRVGEVVVNLQVGDLYAISGSARWNVDHEVHASTSDRLSITLRYVQNLARLHGEATSTTDFGLNVGYV